MLSVVGEIQGINRYPVKSFAGENLESCMIEPYGMLGDRFCSFYDESKEGWRKYITARNIPNMLTYQAQFIDGQIHVTASDGRTFGWDDNLLEEIQSQTKTPITMSGLKAVHPQLEHPQLLSVDGASILLITDASLKKLEATWGHSLDPRRFRGNFVIALNDDSLFEGDWIGRRLNIGDAQLQVDSFCERCVVITMDPDSLQKDPVLLKKLHKEFDLHFGVYASVIKTGQIRIGDKVELVD
ncbi:MULTISPECIES: MOSC domain-containing protein [Paenibacillus]|uniref:Sulfurase n=1 Tax=Paenibacillus odorifer TaxID=189426 RepID=A0A1R0XA34_9BACL|nr:MULTISPECIES: MOSC domain-containing protein [Paenibacillus]AIQ75250.1 sulfurase [Paenibacillus odorifer]ETT46116.1 MOSC domain-containing protein [Paenibacillus sp. FSL H8-237]OMD31671.1 sulfurase [Paenibacillus odorifer]OME37284.1 sulfurase [Paenibacillus odorifer]OME41224.1 sulfurase [Paenibacillus odorifer]